MTSEWRPSTWGQEISLEYGKALRGYQDGKSGYRVFGSNGPIGWTDKFLTKGPGVILGRKGAYRGVHFSKDPFYVIDTAYYVEPKSEMDRRWLYYAIQHYKLGEIDDGSPIPSTTRAAVYVRDLEVPPVEQQREIGRVLAALDDRIDHNRALAANLEAIARALFKSWFVDFDPVRAKAAGETPPGLAPDLAALFPDRLVDSELGEIPEGWSAEYFGDSFEFTMGQSPPGSTYNEIGEGLPFFQGCTDFGSIQPSVRVFCTEPTRYAKRGDVLMSVRAPVGSVNIAPFECAIGRGICAVRHKQGSTPYAYLHLKANAVAIDGAAGEGAVFKSLGKNQLAKMKVLSPTSSVVSAFTSVVDPVFARLLVAEMETESLAHLRDLLLPRLISGRLRVEDVEKLVEAVP